MKTIAVTIDDETLAALDRLAGASGRGRSGRKHGNRSKLVRLAVREFIARRAQARAEEAEWQVWQQHLDRINEQAAALVREQAEP